ncbi:hypothetical protein GZZ45_17760 [Klebsiella aerogenes]|uniref:hypothetical protein n=1 Tax=Klebsiella aerogenes TaxID=548 RepID=UPI00190797D2|nr:hypothetical protein [Klebsiella aerogenes]MBK0490034.1 hypothetical protein [Klebsiella aerogenes]
MFTVNHHTNKISPVNSRLISGLGFTKRQHLQELLALQPDAPGEEFLIFQKEFYGVDDIRERLYSQMLDKNVLKKGYYNYV